jgi:hypothetical protein
MIPETTIIRIGGLNKFERSYVVAVSVSQSIVIDGKLKRPAIGICKSDWESSQAAQPPGRFLDSSTHRGAS